MRNPALTPEKSYPKAVLVIRSRPLIRVERGYNTELKSHKKVNLLHEPRVAI